MGFKAIKCTHKQIGHNLTIWQITSRNIIPHSSTVHSQFALSFCSLDCFCSHVHSLFMFNLNQSESTILPSSKYINYSSINLPKFIFV
jgi:hypothetical protein